MKPQSVRNFGGNGNTTEAALLCFFCCKVARRLSPGRRGGSAAEPVRHCWNQNSRKKKRGQLSANETLHRTWHRTGLDCFWRNCVFEWMRKWRRVLTCDVLHQWHFSWIVSIADFRISFVSRISVWDNRWIFRLFQYSAAKVSANEGPWHSTAPIVWNFELKLFVWKKSAERESPAEDEMLTKMSNMNNQLTSTVHSNEVSHRRESVERCTCCFNVKNSRANGSRSTALAPLIHFF